MIVVADTSVMTPIDTDTAIIAAVTRQRLERIQALFPAEVAAAVRLAADQAAALAALETPIEQAP